MVLVVAFWIRQSRCVEDLELVLAVLGCCEDIIRVGICLHFISTETRADVIRISLHREFMTFILISIGVIAIYLRIITITLRILSLQTLHPLRMVITCIVGSFNRFIFIVIHVGMLSLWFIYFYFCIDRLWWYLIICDEICNLVGIYLIVFLWVFWVWVQQVCTLVVAYSMRFYALFIILIHWMLFDVLNRLILLAWTLMYWFGLEFYMGIWALGLGLH